MTDGQDVSDLGRRERIVHSSILNTFRTKDGLRVSG